MTTGAVEVDEHEVGRRAARERALFEARKTRRRGGQFAEERGEAQTARMDERQRQGKHGFDADDSERGLLEGRALRVLVVGRVVAGDGVDGPVGESSTTAARSSSPRRGGRTLAKVR